MNYNFKLKNLINPQKKRISIKKYKKRTVFSIEKFEKFRKTTLNK